MPTRLTAEIIAVAILGFEEQKLRIDSPVSELRACAPAVALPLTRRTARSASMSGSGSQELNPG
jgi:hypothetical protein